MSGFEGSSSELERLIADLAARIVPPQMSEFEDVWKTANAVCDRYGVGCFRQDLPEVA